MSIKTLKKKTFEILCKSLTCKRAQELIKEHDDDFYEFKMLGISPSGIAAAILMGY